jgi:hypothetical protein
MTKHRITEAEDAALNTALSSALSEFKAAAFERAPRPSAELLARLEMHGASAGEAPVSVSTETVSKRKKRVRQMLSWVTGLGVFAKIVLASSVASAAVLGAGAAGVLPGGAQEVFNSAVSSVTDPEATPTDSPSPQPSSSYANFGGQVSDLAHELGKDSDGHAFGKYISELAKGNGNKPDVSDDNESDDESTTDDEPGVDTHTGGKPAETPGGKQG